MSFNHVFNENEMPLVTIITPVFNGVNYIRETIDSVLNQTYKNIEYIIVDGGSTDGTVDIIKEYNRELKFWISEKDMGMYDALCKGFKKSTGSIVGYINAGDILNHKAIQIVVEQFLSNNVKWLTGMRTVCNENSEIISCDLPFRYKSNLIRQGCYGKYLPFIQQESTFWHSDLLNNVNFDILRKLKLAGDYYLWYSFSSIEEMSIVSSQLGVFKKHYGQLSSDIERYHDEIKSFCEKKTMKSYVSIFYECFFWALHPKLRNFFYKNVITFNVDKNRWLK